MDKLYIDADTLLIASAEQQDNKLCLARHPATQWERLFESKTKFNEFLKRVGKEEKKGEFEFDVIREAIDPENAVRFACKSVRDKIEGIVEAVGTDDFYICIQGQGNYRKLYNSKFVQYKANREGYEKPLVYAEVVEWMKKKWKARLLVIEDEETDDFVCRQATAGNVVAFVDKDIPANCTGKLINYNKLEAGVFENTTDMMMRNFYKQVLTGDAVDNIDGIVILAEETKKKYGIKNKGCGDASAEKILNSCADILEMHEAVREAYELAWPNDWQDRITDMTYFLWMKREQELETPEEQRLQYLRRSWDKLEKLDGI